MEIGTALVIIAVLCVLVNSAGFRRFALLCMAGLVVLWAICHKPLDSDRTAAMTPPAAPVAIPDGNNVTIITKTAPTPKPCCEVPRSASHIDDIEKCRESPSCWREQQHFVNELFATRAQALSPAPPLGIEALSPPVVPDESDEERPALNDAK
jgi:hypothetical protein